MSTLEIVCCARREVPIYGSAHYERAATKQASKKAIRDAQSLLRQDPLAE